MTRVLVLALIALTAAACSRAVDPPGSVSLERGKYLVTIMGCNDCHTPGYLAAAGNVPEKEWLTGDAFGWRGPWGTTYGTNLRIFLQDMTEAEWVEYARTFATRPPMPWFTMHKLTESDSRSMYRYISSLGPVGKPAPDYVPPDQEPDPPYALFPAPPPE